MADDPFVKLLAHVITDLMLRPAPMPKRERELTPKPKRGPQPKRRVKWIPCRVGTVIREPLGRVVLTVVDQRLPGAHLGETYTTIAIGKAAVPLGPHEVVEVIQWTPSTRIAGLRRLEAVLGVERLKGARCERGELS